MKKIWLRTKLGCNSDVRASVRSCQRIKGGRDYSNGESEESDSRVRSRVRVICSIMSTSEKGLQLEFESAPDVRMSARISLRFKVK